MLTIKIESTQLIHNSELKNADDLQTLDPTVWGPILGSVYDHKLCVLLAQFVLITKELTNRH